jgi:hypothetical protein
MTERRMPGAARGRRAAVSVAGFLLLGLTAGCGGQLPVGGERRVGDDERPRWIQYPSRADRDDAKAFAGASLDVATEGQARTGALADARQQIIDAVGVYGTREIRELTTSAGLAHGILQPDVVTEVASEMVSESLVRTRAEEYYIEKWERMTPEGLVSYYKGFVLVYFSNADAQDAVAQAARRAVESRHDETTRASLDRALEVMRTLDSKDW